MAEQKTYSIRIDGIEQSVQGVESLGTNLTKTGNAFKDTQKAIKGIKAEMAGLDKNSDQWKELAKVAGDYKDRLDDINQAIRRNASDTKALDDAINVAQSMTSTFTLAKGAMSAFGLETEGAVEAIQKLQGAMAIIQSLQTLQNTLKGSTATADLLTKSYKALTLSMEGATTATKAFKVALASIGIGLVIIAITELVSHWDDLTEAIGLSNKKLEESNQLFEESIGAYAKGKAELQAYISKLENFNGTKDQEKQLVEECNKKYGEAFGHYNTLAQWKDVLIQKTEAYCKTLMLEAQMQAKVNQLTQAYEKVAKAKKEFNRVKEGDLTYWEQVKDFFSPGGAISNARDEFQDAMKGANALEAEIEDLAKTIAEHNFQNGLFPGGGGKTTKTVKTTKEGIDQIKKTYTDWIKAALKAERELEAEKKRIQEEELKRLERMKKLKEKNLSAEQEYQKQLLKLELQNAKTDEEKLKVREKIIEFDKKIAEEEKKLAAADAMGISVEEIENRLTNTQATYMGLNEEQKQVMQTLITQLSTVKLAAEESKNALKEGAKSQSGKTSGDTKQISARDIFKKDLMITVHTVDEDGNEITAQTSVQDAIASAYEAYAAPIVEGLGDSIHMMLEFAIEEAEAALEEAEEMHDEAVEKVAESKDRLSELNDKMKDSSGAQLEAYKTQMADEMLLLQQREQEERRLQKEKEKREKELEKQKKKQRKLELQQQLVQAIVSGALAVVNGLATQPFMPVGIAMGALAAVATAIQIATITKQMSKLAEGGLLSGKSHAQGGIPVGNTGIEVEGGEYIVNKRSTAKYLPLLQQINEEGARKKTVANQLGKMANGGQLNYERIATNSESLDTAKIVSTAIGSLDMHPVVSVVDINRGQRNMTEVRQLAGASS